MMSGSRTTLADPRPVPFAPTAVIAFERRHGTTARVRHVRLGGPTPDGSATVAVLRRIEMRDADARRSFDQGLLAPPAAGAWTPDVGRLHANPAELA